MSTRLTKELRTNIVDAVLEATVLDAQEADIVKRTVALATEIVAAKVPPGLLELTKKNPKAWFKWDEATCMYGNNPFDFCPSQRNGYISYTEPMPIAEHDYVITPEESVRFELLRKEAEAIYEMRWQMRAELMAFLMSCTTVEKVIERMPELTPYIKTENKSFALVVSTSNLLSTLMKSGFVVAPVEHA